MCNWHIKYIFLSAGHQTILQNISLIIGLPLTTSFLVLVLIFQMVKQLCNWPQTIMVHH